MGDDGLDAQKDVDASVVPETSWKEVVEGVQGWVDWGQLDDSAFEPDLGGAG